MDAMYRTRNATPTPPLTLPTVEPTTIRTFKRYTNTLLIHQSIKPALKANLNSLFYYVEISLVAGVEAIDQLASLTVRMNAAKARNLQKRSHIQKGGVLQAKNARHIVSKREDNPIYRIERELAKLKDDVLKARIKGILAKITGIP